MAYITKGKVNSWEIRESATTDRGPRSRTLATFAELDEGAIARAVARTQGTLDPGAIRREAVRKGAPVAVPRATRAGRTLVYELARGKSLPPGLSSLLCHELETGGLEPSAEARAAAEWVDADPADRAAALWDLLLLVDRIPARPSRRALAFPRMRTVRA